MLIPGFHRTVLAGVREWDRWPADPFGPAKRYVLSCIIAVLTSTMPVGNAVAELRYYRTWINDWGELPLEDDVFMGAHCRAQYPGWEVAIWDYGHHTAATSEYGWADGQWYRFRLDYDWASGTAVYRLFNGPSQVLEITGNVGRERGFNIFYVYAKNVEGNEIVIDDLAIDDVPLASLAGFDGQVRIGVDGITKEVVKFIDTSSSPVLHDGVSVTGRFYLEEPSAVTGENMQVSVKFIHIPGPPGGSEPPPDPEPVPGLGRWAFLLIIGLLSFVGWRQLRSQRGRPGS